MCMKSTKLRIYASVSSGAQRQPWCQLLFFFSRAHHCFSSVFRSIFSSFSLLFSLFCCLLTFFFSRSFPHSALTNDTQWDESIQAQNEQTEITTDISIEIDMNRVHLGGTSIIDGMWRERDTQREVEHERIFMDRFQWNLMLFPTHCIESPDAS